MGILTVTNKKQKFNRLSARSRLENVVETHLKRMHDESVSRSKQYKARALERHKARGRTEITSFTGRIVVSRFTDFFRMMFPYYLFTDNLRDWRQDLYSGMVYTGDVVSNPSEVMGKLFSVHTFFILKDEFDTGDKANSGILELIGSERVIHLNTISDFIKWYYPDQPGMERLCNGYKSLYAERMGDFLNMLASQLVLRTKKLPCASKLKKSSAYPIYEAIGDRDYNAFFHTFFGLERNADMWVIESSLFTFLGRVMDGEVFGSYSRYSTLVRNAKFSYGSRVKFAVKRYALSKKSRELALIDLYLDISEAGESVGGISDDFGMDRNAVSL